MWRDYRVALFNGNNNQERREWHTRVFWSDSRDEMICLFRFFFFSKNGIWRTRGIHLMIPREFYSPNNAACSREGHSRDQITFPVDVTSSPSNRISCCSWFSADDCFFELAIVNHRCTKPLFGLQNHRLIVWFDRLDRTSQNTRKKDKNLSEKTEDEGKGGEEKFGRSVEAWDVSLTIAVARWDFRHLELLQTHTRIISNHLEYDLKLKILLIVLDILKSWELSYGLISTSIR